MTKNFWKGEQQQQQQQQKQALEARAFRSLALKKWFFSEMDHFLFTEQANLVVRKIGYSTTPKCFWNILLLRSDVKDFQTWLFCTSMWSPLMLR